MASLPLIQAPFQIAFTVYSHPRFKLEPCKCKVGLLAQSELVITMILLCDHDLFLFAVPGIDSIVTVVMKIWCTMVISLKTDVVGMSDIILPTCP
jgi:hypothetical protein